MDKFKFKTTGIVKEILENNIYLVELTEDGSVVQATLSGKARLGLSHDIIVGEEVPIERTPYDLTRARIRTRNWERPSPKGP